MVEYRTRNREVAGSTHTRSTAMRGLLLMELGKGREGSEGKGEQRGEGRRRKEKEGKEGKGGKGERGEERRGKGGKEKGRERRACLGSI